MHLPQVEFLPAHFSHSNLVENLPIGYGWLVLQPKYPPLQFGTSAVHCTVISFILEADVIGRLLLSKNHVK